MHVSDIQEKKKKNVDVCFYQKQLYTHIANTCYMFFKLC